MRILAMGDPHGKLPKNFSKIKNIDLILIPGDLGKADLIRKITFDEKLQEKITASGKHWTEFLPRKTVKKTFSEIIVSTKKIIKCLSKKAPVYWIHGNVEKGIDKEIKRLNLKIPLLRDITKMKNIHLINNKVITFKNIRIAGVKFFHELNLFDKIKLIVFYKNLYGLCKKGEEVAKEFFKKIEYVDILLAHEPPYKILDKVTYPKAPKKYQGKNAGNKLILKYCKKYKPKYVLFGHIHEGKGLMKKGETTYINLGANGRYKIIEI